MADNKFLPNLSQNLLEILNDEEYYDITIEVGNDPNVKIFRAHMVILNYRSPYLRKILSTIEKRNDGTIAHIKLPKILPEIFQIILRYIYGGRLSLAEYDTSDVFKILIASRELNLQELISHLQSFLIENQTSWLEQNFCLIYQTSFEDNSLSKLRNFCTKLMSNDPKKIFNLPDFTSISENALISLIRHDNLKMSEVQVWEYVLKWGIAQNSELSSDPSSYSNDNFNALRNTLQQFIFLIKFTKFTPREFLNKVFPYKRIIPDEINEDLIKYFLDHDYVPNGNSEQQTTNETNDINLKNIDSNIITNQHAVLISKWIDRLETDESKNSYEFKLILRGSRDGFTPEKFLEICDSRSYTITVIKVEGSNEILGGYNPIEWKYGDKSYRITKDSFIFSFKNDNNIDDYILSRVKDENKALFYDLDYGPSFGYGDLIIKSNYLFNGSKKNFNHCYCKKYSYESAIRKTGNYTIKEYEIFQITKDT